MATWDAGVSISDAGISVWADSAPTLIASPWLADGRFVVAHSPQYMLSGQSVIVAAIAVAVAGAVAIPQAAIATLDVAAVVELPLPDVNAAVHFVAGKLAVWHFSGQLIDPVSITPATVSALAIPHPGVTSVDYPGVRDLLAPAVSLSDIWYFGGRQQQASVVITYYLCGWDAGANQFVYWQSVGVPDFSPAVTMPALVGALSGAFVVGTVLQ